MHSRAYHSHTATHTQAKTHTHTISISISITIHICWVHTLFSYKYLMCVYWVFILLLQMQNSPFSHTFHSRLPSLSDSSDHCSDTSIAKKQSKTKRRLISPFAPLFRRKKSILRFCSPRSHAVLFCAYDGAQSTADSAFHFSALFTTHTELHHIHCEGLCISCIYIYTHWTQQSSTACIQHIHTHRLDLPSFSTPSFTPSRGFISVIPPTSSLSLANN